jgi:hypothetical protein
VFVVKIAKLNFQGSFWARNNNNKKFYLLYTIKPVRLPYKILHDINNGTALDVADYFKDNSPTINSPITTHN